jgi:hypothetical protein
LGDANGALKTWRSKIASAVLFDLQPPMGQCGRATNKIEPHPNSKALETLAGAALEQAYLNVGEDFEGPAALATEARRLRPASISARKNALLASEHRGRGRIATPSRALDDYRKAQVEFEELSRWDPDSKLWQRERAATQLLVSEGIVACHKSKDKD